MKIDPNKNKGRYLNWKDKTSEGIPDIVLRILVLLSNF